MAMISVVVPVHNTSKYLEQCISSIVNQTFKDIEIIFVDDGSTDNSLEIINKFKENDSRITVIHREKASGSASVPRNTGLSVATGKYIIFLDSDDFFDTTMFEKMYNHAEEKNADLVMCDNYVYNTEHDKFRNQDGELHHKYLPNMDVFSYKDIPDRIFQISNATVWHKLVLRELIVSNNLEFQEGVPILDDIYYVNYLLMIAERISIVDEKLVYYREAREGAQTTRIAKHKESVYYAFKKLNDRLMSEGLYDKVKDSLQEWTLATLAWWYYSIYELDASKKTFELYHNEYFNKLGLLEINKDKLTDDSLSFHKDILNGKYEPPMMVMLNTQFSTGKRIVIYGAGNIGEKVYEFISENTDNEIVLWCDKNAEKINNGIVQLPEKIKECTYDAVIIAIAKKNFVSEVKKYLAEMGIDERKIYTV